MLYLLLTHRLSVGFVFTANGISQSVLDLWTMLASDLSIGLRVWDYFTAARNIDVTRRMEYMRQHIMTGSIK